MLDRRKFLRFGSAAAVCGALPGCATAAVPGPKPIDPNLAVFISDLHVNGQDAKPTFQRDYLEREVARILSLKTLPANVVCFGDIAYLWGRTADYRLARQLLQPLVDAGMKLTLGMGNHDHREHFLEVWPELAANQPVAGRIISTVDMPHCELLMLDSLNHEPIADRGASLPGELGKAQHDWMMAHLAQATKPVFVCAHHKPDECKFGKPWKDRPRLAGFIHGHWHRWMDNFHMLGWSDTRIMRVCGLPSTGHWGDIGFALFRTDEKKAKVTAVIDDYFFPHPVPKAERPAPWDAIRADHHGRNVTFPYPVIEKVS